MINDDYADAAMEAEFAEDEDIRRAALGFISDAWAEAGRATPAEPRRALQ